MASVIAYDTLRIPNNPREITFNSPNYKVVKNRKIYIAYIK